MNSVDLAFAPALQQAQLIRTKEVSPLELVQVYLERIEKFNPQLSCYFTVIAEKAIAQAKSQTQILARTQDLAELPPFFGVPIAIKDLNPVADVPCTYGNPALRDRVATYDDAVVARVKQAGFIILGKTATSELGSFPYTEPRGFPPSRNPWNPEYTPGGSSGGSAAAVAAGLSAIAQGSDAGGSIRGPAFCCGLVGIKPARGRVSYAPFGDRLSGVAANGPIARTVTDAAALLDVMSGYVTGDPYWLPAPNPSFLTAATQPPTSLRIAFTNSLPQIGVADSVCQQAVLGALRLLEAMGHRVEEGCPDFTSLIEPFTTVWQAGVAYAGIPKEILQPMNQWLLEQSSSAGDYLRAVDEVQVIARRIVAFFDSVDVLILPTYMHPPIRVGEWAELSPEETLQKIINWVAPCPPFNASGLPAIAIPTGFTPNGLPIGIQIVGRPAAEATIIALAAQLEVDKFWNQHRPAIGNG